MVTKMNKITQYQRMKGRQETNTCSVMPVVIHEIEVRGFIRTFHSA